MCPSEVKSALEKIVSYYAVKHSVHFFERLYAHVPNYIWTIGTAQLLRKFLKSSVFYVGMYAYDKFRTPDV
jgi:predicted metal-dependent HD superfamily phosphohydrolase